MIFNLFVRTGEVGGRPANNLLHLTAVQCSGNRLYLQRYKNSVHDQLASNKILLFHAIKRNLFSVSHEQYYINMT